MEQIIDILAPHIVTLLSALIAAAIAYATKLLRDYTGVQIQKKLRDDLHSAAMTGIRKALQKGLGSDAAIVEATSWVQTKGAPDAVKAFQMSADDIAAVVASKLTAIAEDKIRAVAGR